MSPAYSVVRNIPDWLFYVIAFLLTVVGFPLWHAGKRRWNLLGFLCFVIALLSFMYGGIHYFVRRLP